MSWGERSCIHFGGCKYFKEYPQPCDDTCPKYEWDGKTEPDYLKTKKLLKQLDNATNRIEKGMTTVHGSNKRKRRSRKRRKRV